MKILIITYYWPPAGGPGVQRWLKFVKYFRDFGIEPVVYTPENPTYPLTDPSLHSEIPEDITILKHPIFEPYRFASLFSKKETSTISKGIIANQDKQSLIQKVMLYIRGNFFIPDARKFWVKPSVKYLKKYLSEHHIDTIITTGPPHSVHLIGKLLKEQLSINWLADFRDPWTTIGYHNKLKPTNKTLAKHKRQEKEVLTTADHITVTSFTTQKEFESITTQPITVITNGYDIESSVKVSLDKKFTIAHIGSLLSGRNPINLWKALYELMQEDHTFAKALQLQLTGAVSDDVLSSIKASGLSDVVSVTAYVSHQEAIQLQRRSQLLLLVEINAAETRCIIPGKVFEYMTSGRPILALGPNKADIKTIIEETQSGCFFAYDEYEGIKTQIKLYFEAYQARNLFSKAQNIDQYSRKQLTQKMAKVIQDI